MEKNQTRQGHPAKSAQSSSNGVAVLEDYHLSGTLYTVNGTQQSLWSNLGMLLAEHNMSVLALHKRLQEKGVSVNLKSLYRLAGFSTAPEV